MTPGTNVRITDGVYVGHTGVVVSPGADAWAGWLLVAVDPGVYRPGPTLLHPEQLEEIASTRRTASPQGDFFGGVS